MKIAKKIFLLGNTPVKDVFILQHLLVTDVSFELIEIKNAFAAACFVNIENFL